MSSKWLFVFSIALLICHSYSEDSSDEQDDFLSETVCESDKDCQRIWKSSICLGVEISGEVVRKCTPNTKKKPACRGGSMGLCPSYQPPHLNYLNPQCIFEDMEEFIEMEKDEGRNITLCKRGDSSSSCLVEGKSKKNPNATIIGRFRCVDASGCEDVASDPTTCQPENCHTGPKSFDFCNFHGTCTHSSLFDLSKRKCNCYSGYGGKKCEKTISNECDIDCGAGGKCRNGKCKCFKYWDGDNRCTKCSSDKACKNGGTCNLKSGKCECLDGYHGLTCGGTSHECVGVDCGKGNCINGQCFCPLCNPSCLKCPNKECTGCPSASTSYFANYWGQNPLFLWMGLGIWYSLVHSI